MGRYVLRLNSTKDRAEAARLLSISPDGTRLEFSRNSRSLDQNDKVHAMCREVSKKAKLHGVERDVDTWKAVFLHAVGKEVPVVPSLDGRGFVALGLKTSKLTIQECSDLIEYINCWCAENQIELTDPRYGPVAA